VQTHCDHPVRICRGPGPLTQSRENHPTPKSLQKPDKATEHRTKKEKEAQGHGAKLRQPARPPQKPKKATKQPKTIHRRAEARRRNEVIAMQLESTRWIWNRLSSSNVMATVFAGCPRRVRPRSIGQLMLLRLVSASIALARNRLPWTASYRGPQ